MTLAEKITVLRTDLKLSQGDVAEKLEVSRQSVSKWETGQSVPELDKIVKLADLFGVSVDGLVRDGEEPRPSAPQRETTQPKIVYVERRQLTPAQILGIIMMIGGLICTIMGTALSAYLLITGIVLAVLGLPLLLAKKHPFLIAGWVLWALACGVFCSPALRGGAVSPLHGFALLAKAVTDPSGWMQQDRFSLRTAFLIEIPIAVLTVVLACFTVRACLLWRKARKKTE